MCYVQVMLIRKAIPMLLIQNGAGAGFREVLFSALLAMAAFDPGVAAAQEWPKQIKLTEQHIRGFLAATNEMAKLVSGVDLKDLADADRPDPKVQAQAKLVAQKKGFASLAEFSDVSENILFIFMGIDVRDPQKKFQPAVLIKQSISVLKSDDSVPEEQKKVRVAMLEEVIQKIKPIRFKNN